MAKRVQSWKIYKELYKEPWSPDIEVLELERV